MSDEEIAAIEISVGEPLPADYRWFLQTHGRSRFAGIVRSDSAPYDDISFFYGGGDNPHHIGHLRRALAVFGGRIPQELLPIAHCDDGQICLGVKGDMREKVYYWDRWNEWTWQQQEKLKAGQTLRNEERFQNVSELAGTFEQFISGLVIVDE